MPYLLHIVQDQGLLLLVLPIRSVQCSSVGKEAFLQLLAGFDLIPAIPVKTTPKLMFFVLKHSNRSPYQVTPAVQQVLSTPVYREWSWTLDQGVLLRALHSLKGTLLKRFYCDENEANSLESSSVDFSLAFPKFLWRIILYLKK